MTASGQRFCVEKVAASEPIPVPGQPPVTIKTPLPKGWASFCSKPDEESAPHWYAVPPYNVLLLKERFGNEAWGLETTVVALTWHGLHVAVAAQECIYQELTRGLDLPAPTGMTCPNGQCGGTMTKHGDVYVCGKCGYTM